MTDVLAVIEQKGGVGKTLACRSFSVAAVLDGIPAALIDTDPQGSASKWGMRRPHPAPAIYTPLAYKGVAVVSMLGKPLSEMVADAKKRGVRFLVIDTPPHALPAINVATEQATACLLVTGPNPEDLEAMAPTVRLVQQLGKPAGVLINRTKSQRCDLARAALTVFGLPVCPVALVDRVGHPYASAEGLVAQEREPSSVAAAELAEAWAWVRATLLS